MLSVVTQLGICISWCARALIALRSSVTGRSRRLSILVAEQILRCVASWSNVGTARPHRHVCTQPQNGAWHTFAGTFLSRHRVTRIVSEGKAYQNILDPTQCSNTCM